MKAFIIDDENNSRHILKYLITKYCSDLEIIGDAADYTNGVIEIQKLQPDILFLDINLGNNKTGFQILDTVKQYNISVIFITAYEEYALKAFQYSNVVHYILKPIDPIDLVEAVNRIFNKKEQFNKINQKNESKISLPYKNGMEMVAVEEILYIEGDGSYCKIFLKDDKVITISRNLKFLIKKLEEFPQFIRVHKSYVVNVHQVNLYIRKDGGQLELTNKIIIPVSITYKEGVLAFFQKEKSKK